MNDVPSTGSPDFYGLDPDAPEMRMVRAAFFRQVGRPLARKEDRRLLTGEGRFTDDFSLPGQAYGAVVRSPHPHARITALDASAAHSMPGVLAVLTADEMRADGLAPIPHNPLPKTRFDMKLTAPDGGVPFIGPHRPLADGRVRHVGEAVAFVVAETAAQAADAADAVEVDYEVLPFVLDAAEAADPGAPAVWDEVPGNVFVETRFGDAEATETAFARAAHVVEGAFHIQRVTGVPLEPRAALGSYDAETGTYSLVAGSGGAVRQRSEIAEVLGIAPERLRVRSHDVGGNFGTRNRTYAEFPLTLWAARRTGRPVKWTATRSESFLTDYQGRDLHTHVALALDAEGRFLALRADNLSNVGARCVSLSPLSKGAGLVTGPYDIPVASLRARAAFTNTTPTQAYRSSGRPEVIYAIERLCELAAERLGADPIELRRSNLVPPERMPYRNAVGMLYDSGTYEANLDRVLALADHAGLPERRRKAQARGRLLGFAATPYVESSIGSPKERAELTVAPDGTVELVIGTQPSGQGHETSFAQVAADMLQMDAADVSVVLGDTSRVSLGGGTHSGRSMRHAATVMAMAAADIVGEARSRAGACWDCAAEEVVFEDGWLRLPGTNHAVTLGALAGETADSHGPLAVKRDNEMHHPVFPNGAAACELEIDPETGALEITRYVSVDDVGRCINPLIVHGQTHGGIAQGVGQALWEECAIDSDSGQPLAGSFMDYAMPRADAMPRFVSEIVEVHSPTNPLGIKAGGEGGTTPALATVTLAVLDALKPFGVTDVAMPITSATIFEAIMAARGGKEFP